MLADFLNSNKEVVVRAVEPRAAAEEPLGLQAERRTRLEAILEELIQALRGGGMDGPNRTPASGRDTAVASRARALLRREVTELIEQRGVQATFREGMIVSDWESSPDRERLREHDHWLSVLLDSVNEAALIFSPDGRIQYVNGKGASVLHDATGVPPDEIVGKTGAELGAPGELAVGLSPDELVAKASVGASDESHRFGRWRDRRFGAFYRLDGTLGAVTLVSRDIQQQKLASTRAQMLFKLGMLVSNVDYEDVAEALARVPIPELADWCVVNLLEGDKIRSTYVGQLDPGKSALGDALAREVRGWARHPLWQELLLGGFQLLTEVSDDLRRRLTTNEAQYRLLTQVGVQSLMVVPVVSRGRTAGIITLVYTAESGRRYGRDDSALAEDLAFSAAHVMENARLLRELKSSEARFRVALAGARTAVYEQDRSLRIVWSHNSLVPSSLVGKTHEDVFAPEDAARLNRFKEGVLESGERAYGEFDVTPGGKRRQFRQAVDAVRDHAGKVVGVIGAATDITEEKRVQEELRDALAFRDRMTAILGHDLRNPLSAATVAAEALNRRPDLPEASRQQKVTVIKRATARMTEMIDTLLEFARVHAAGNLPVSPKPFDLGSVVREVTDEARAAHPDRAIEVDVSGDLRGEWDPARMAQALSNLIGNAMVYGAPQTPVRVSAHGEGAEVLLNVKNDGPPIPPEVIPVFFEPFRRGARDTSPHHIGLGLYIVKQIVVAHGGTIDVDSSAENGTTFKMGFPRTHDPSTVAPTTQT